MTALQNRRILGASALGFGLLLTAMARRARAPFAFHGKSVLITGASRGLGLVLARRLAAEGAGLTLVARDKADLERAADDMRRRWPAARVLIVAADIRERANAERAVAAAIERYGRIDVLLNNAGIIEVGPLEHMALSDYEEAMTTHFWAPLYMVLAALPHMRHQQAGRIVNISSIGGKIAVPHLVPYSASKFALTGLSDGLRIELAHDNITVTTVCPGLMRTGSPVNAMFKGKRAQEHAWFAIADSLPLVTIGAERAARQIIAACRRGDAELVITVPAKLAIVAHAVAPELFADAMTMINRLLPAAAGREGDVAQRGEVSAAGWATSKLMAPTYAAARRNNEL